MLSGSDSLDDAIGLALEVGDRALSHLRSLRNELDAAKAAEEGKGIWPLAMFTFVSRRRRRRAIMEQTAVVQAALSDLDKAVVVLREQGLDLDVRMASRAQRIEKNYKDPWSGPLHVAKSAMQRVQSILDELRRQRGGEDVEG